MSSARASKISRRFADPTAAELTGRTMWVKKTQPLPVECIVRGYLAGSGWKDYQKTGMVCGIRTAGRVA